MLEQKACGVTRARHGEPGWTIAFKYKSTYSPAGDARAVTMDEFGNNLRVEHKDLILRFVDKRL